MLTGVVIRLTDMLCVCALPGVDDLLAKHVAHLFIRDPLVIYGITRITLDVSTVCCMLMLVWLLFSVVAEERIEIDDATNVDHFEVLVSSPLTWSADVPHPSC